MYSFFTKKGRFLNKNSNFGFLKTYINSMRSSMFYKLFPVLISLLLLFPVLKENISSIILILLCINTILFKLSIKDYNFIKRKTLLFCIPFFIILFRSFFSNDFQTSTIHILHALPFLIVPLVFSNIPNEFFDQKKVNLYLNVIKNLCLIIAIVYVIDFLINIPLWRLNFADGSVFRTYIYSYFDLFVIHPTYYTTILILCVAHSMDLILTKRRYVELIYVFVFISIALLLLTKLNIVLMILVIGLMIYLKGNFKKLHQLTIISSLFLIFVTTVIFTPGLKIRFQEIYNSYNEPPKHLAYNSTNIRKAIFDCSVAISKENLIVGVGFDKLQQNLNNCYKSNYESSFYENHNYMTHNYYFYILLSSGLTGLLVYIFYLVFIVKQAIKSNMVLFQIFIVNALILCLVEDYFYRQNGVLYFNVILMIFVRYLENKIFRNDSKIT